MSSEKKRLTDTDEIGASAVPAGDAQHNSPRMQPVETLTDSDEIDATVILANGAHNDDVSTQPAAGCCMHPCTLPMPRQNLLPSRPVGDTRA